MPSTMNEFLENAFKGYKQNEVRDVDKSGANSMVKKHQKSIEKIADDLNIPFESIFNAIAKLAMQYYRK